MDWKTNIKFISIVSLLTACNLIVGSVKQDIKWKKFYAITDCPTSILLSVSDNGNIFNDINLLIIKNSEYLELFQDTIELNAIKSEQDFRSLFLDFENYEAMADTMFYELRCEKYADTLFIYNEILVYSITVNRMGDKGSPYVESILIDTYTPKIITLFDIVDSSSYFPNFMEKFTKDKKSQILHNHFGNPDEKEDTDPYNNILTASNYDFNKFHVMLDNTELILIDSIGITLRVEFKDENFNKEFYDKYYEERFGSKNNNAQHCYEASTFIKVPFKQIKPYFNKKSSLYTTLNELAKCN